MFGFLSYLWVLITSLFGGWDDVDDGAGMKDLRSCKLFDKVEETEVVVVGAGLAGLFAAAVLKKNGVDYRLVEADDQVGGRLRSFESDFKMQGATGDNLVLEQAANYFYGIGMNNRINPTYGLFERFGMNAFENTGAAFSMFTPNGEKISAEVVKNETDLFVNAIGQCLDKEGNKWFDEWVLSSNSENRLDRFQRTPDQSSLETLANCEAVGGWFPDTPLKEALATFFHQLEFGQGLSETSKACYPDESSVDFDEREFVGKDQRGSNYLTSAFASEELDDDKVHLKSRVTRIRFTDSDDVKVVARVDGGESSFGDCKQKYRAKYVINTMPINVVEEEETKGDMFSPSVDIEDHPLRQVLMEKYFVQFDTAWWNEDGQENLYFLVTNEHAGGQVTSWINYDHPDWFPGSKILLAFLGKDEYAAATVDGRFSKEKLEENVLSSFQTFPNYPTDQVPRTYLTDWQHDPFFRGSWESWKVGKTYADFEAAIQPQGKLHKAGSAYCSRHWGFTYGGIMSGMEQGQWVVNRMLGVAAGESVQPYSPCTDDGSVRDEEWKLVLQNYGFWDISDDKVTQPAYFD